MKVTKIRLQRIIKEELSKELAKDIAQYGMSKFDRARQEREASMPSGGGFPGSPPDQQSDKYPTWFDGEFDLWWNEHNAGAGADWRTGEFSLGRGPDQYGGQDDTKKFAWMAFKMWLDKPNKTPPVAKTPSGGKGHAMASDLTGGFGTNQQDHYGDSQWGIDGYLNQYSAGNPQHSNPNQDWYKKQDLGGDEDIVAEIIRRLT